MKSKEDLYLEYARCVAMTREYNEKHGTDVKPWECVKWIEGEMVITFIKTPSFDGLINSYAFALTILEGKPVFENSEGFVGEYACLYAHTPIDRIWTWRKAITKKRTFMLGDKELPCPMSHNVGTHVLAIELNGSRHLYLFEDYAESCEVFKAIIEPLTEARDKE